MVFKIFNKIINNRSEKHSVDFGKVNHEEKIKIATCVILLEAVTADDELSTKELHKVIDLLQDKFSTDRNNVNELIEVSQKERDEHPGIWYFTNLINETFDNDEKYELLEMVWEAIYSDGILDKYEDSVSHKLRGLLHIKHSVFIDIKLKVQDRIKKNS